MAIWGEKSLLIKYEELPVINGVRINSIYGRMETAYSTDQLLSDAYDEKPDYYLLCTDDFDYKDGRRVDKKDLKVKELPKELAALFGKQEINGGSVYVTRMTFRTSCSGNGSFTDNSISLDGGCGATSKCITYYRTKRWDKAHSGAVFIGEPLEKKILAVLGKKFKVEALPDGFDVEFPCTYVRNEGGLNYPDLKLPSWRWLYGSPYVTFDNGKNIRVFFEDYNAHLYLERLDTVEEGDEDLVSITFNYGHDKKPDQFCNIAQWADTKKEDPKGIIRFKVLKVDEKANWSYKVAAMVNDKEQFKRDTHNTFYRLVSMIKIK